MIENVENQQSIDFLKQGELPIFNAAKVAVQTSRRRFLQGLQKNRSFRYQESKIVLASALVYR